MGLMVRCKGGFTPSRPTERTWTLGNLFRRILPQDPGDLPLVGPGVICLGIEWDRKLLK